LSAIYGLWGLIAAAIAVPASGYLLLPPRARRSSEWTETADLARLRLNEPEEVVFRRNRVDGWKSVSEKATTWLVKVGGNQVVAFAPQCTHLGCAYHWDASSQHFVCPCHTSAFSIEGEVLAGPAPRPLDRLAVRLENGKVLVGQVVRHEG
jgi:menaquinol-cytochrome c reductase iron-sulfur subunit